MIEGVGRMRVRVWVRARDAHQWGAACPRGAMAMPPKPSSTRLAGSAYVEGLAAASAAR